ncbi:serine/threonine-protein phosphatase [Dickeya dadantii]|uniref:PP2C family protein-serine/threonine phosphatase n=1 Tax=Dickeya dadantii TaxID=204038 RepID=UPI001495B75A|nr:protein phosphatase 2C domain-containing protein [Dickeya dadantii]NPE58365.1 serine/threonine-protein phosphatase [Dickeya dadantii]NPE70852.1 serine/threonine-protein phosphatase [Dickeya dadantii]
MISLLSCGFFSYAKNSLRENQDAILLPQLISDGYLFAIADGVGSYTGSQYASRVAIKELINNINYNTINDISEIFDSIKVSVSELSQKNSDFFNAATTLTFCYVNCNGVHIGHVGDCRLYLIEEGKLKKITKDHTQYQKLIDQKIYGRHELKSLSFKNTLTSAIAKNIEMECQNIFIPFSEIKTSNDELSIVVMSDGAYHFWDKRPRFSFNTINNPMRFASSLYKRIEKNTPIDDHSLIVVKFLIS